MERTKLLELITKRYSLEGIQGLCFSLGIDYDNLAGATKDAKAQALIQYCERNDLIDQLEELAQDKPRTVFGGAVNSPTKARNSIIAVFIIVGLFALVNPLLNAVMPKPPDSASIAPLISTPIEIINTTTPQLPSATPLLSTATQTMEPAPTETVEPSETPMAETSIQPSSPTNASEVSATSTVIEPATIKQNPCQVKITSRESDLLGDGIIQDYPNGPASFLPNRPQVNDDVIVVESRTENSQLWWKITTLQGRKIGWLLGTYLTEIPSDCLV